MKIVICDLDGTVADCTHRRHHVESKPKNWDAFYSACDQDEIFPAIVNLLDVLVMANIEIVYMSGRRDSERAKTQAWMDKYDLPEGALIMRKVGDFRPDTEVKAEMFAHRVACVPGFRKENILFVLDDRASVVKMWRDMGLTCLQVAEGDF
jgi:hypothetical protein